jgi:hypothetical protein
MIFYPALIDKLVDQVSAVTEAAKQIEARISSELWSRQQRWEVQKTALLDSLKELATSVPLKFEPWPQRDPS